MNTPLEQILEDFRINMFEAKVPSEYITTAETILQLLLCKYDCAPKEESLVLYDAGDEELLKRFFLSKAVQGCTEGTLRAYRNHVLYALKIIKKHLKDITSDDLRMLFASMKVKGSSSAHIATVQRALSSFFDWATQNDKLPKNPMMKVERVKVRHKIEEALTEEQMELVRSVMKTRRNKAIIEMLYSTGCRISELCSIDRRDVDWEKREIKVLGKGKKYRIVYISQRAKFAYLAYDEIRKDKSPALFGYDPEMPEHLKKCMNDVIGRPLDWDQGRIEKGSIESLLRGAGKCLGFRLHPHLIRKTMATHAMKRGMPIDQVRVLLGHESIATTTIYAQTLTDNVKASHEKYV